MPMVYRFDARRAFRTRWRIESMRNRHFTSPRAARTF
jgi:hypothetical protein